MWIILLNGHSFGTAIIDQNISWNAARQCKLTITSSNTTGTTFTVGDTVIAAAANIKDSFNGSIASVAVSPASSGSLLLWKPNRLF